MTFNIGKNLKYFRKIADMTQAELAERVGLSVDSIKFIEQGRNLIRLENFVAICNTLNIPPCYLLKDDCKAAKISTLVSLYEELAEYDNDILDAVEKLFLHLRKKQK